MNKKRAIVGFRDIYLNPIKTDTEDKYETLAGIHIPHAGKCSRTVKENSTDIFYDDKLYASLKENMGEDFELSIAEAPISLLETLKVGKVVNGVLEADLDMPPRDYAMRCITDTVDKLPTAWKWRKVTVTSVRVGDFQTKGNGAQVAEVVIKGFIGKPLKPEAKAWALMEMAEDNSNESDFNAFLKNAETIE